MCISSRNDPPELTGILSLPLLHSPHRTTADDPLSAGPMHFGCGMLGIFFTGLLAKKVSAGRGKVDIIRKLSQSESRIVGALEMVVPGATSPRAPWHAVRSLLATNSHTCSTVRASRLVHN